MSSRQASVFDVAKYVLSRHGAMTTMKLQKLCYYSQAWFAAAQGQALFSEDFQAWANGPVCYPLYQEHRKRFFISESDLTVGSIASLPAETLAAIDLILDSYAPLSAAQLSELTHSEDPWKDARQGLPSSEPAAYVIPVDSMIRYYRSLTDSNSTAVANIDWPEWGLAQEAK